MRSSHPFGKAWNPWYMLWIEESEWTQVLLPEQITHQSLHLQLEYILEPLILFVSHNLTILISHVLEDSLSVITWVSFGLGTNSHTLFLINWCSSWCMEFTQFPSFKASSTLFGSTWVYLQLEYILKPLILICFAQPHYPHRSCSWRSTWC